MSNPDTTADRQGKGEPPEGLYQFDRTANKRISTIEDITEEDLGFFQEHGYLVIDKFLDDAEIDAALTGMMSLLEQGDEDIIQFKEGVVNDGEEPTDIPPEVKQNYVRKFMWFVEHSDGMRAPSEKDSLLGLLETIIGNEPEMFQDMALIKPPGGKEKPWHQDKAYFEVNLDAPVVGVWIALEEATAENGCMHIIPGSHKNGPVVHFDRRDWQICDTDVEVDQDVMVPLKPGGALLFDGLLHHGTPPNNSDNLRRALQFHYTATDAEWLEERPEEFGNTDKDVEC